MTDRRHLVQPALLPLGVVLHRTAWTIATLAVVVAVCWLTALAI